MTMLLRLLTAWRLPTTSLRPATVPPLLPVALRMADDIAELLSGDDGDVLIAGVHGLSARNRGIVELPGRLDRAVRVAVRDTGATHRQVKAKDVAYLRRSSQYRGDWSLWTTMIIQER